MTVDRQKVERSSGGGDVLEKKGPPLWLVVSALAFCSAVCSKLVVSCNYSGSLTNFQTKYFRPN